MRLSKKKAETRPARDITINRDILIAGAILHDIGKTNCYKFIDGEINSTIIQSEEEHITNGV